MGLTTCRIQAASTTITFDNGARITLPRRQDDPPEKTMGSVARVLLIDRFEYALSV